MNDSSGRLGSASEPDAASKPGDRSPSDAAELVSIDELEVIEEIGRGAQTVVFRARRAGIDYALKILHRRDGVDDSPLIGYRREAAMLARVDHPGVPRVFDVGLTDGYPYIVLELIDGRPLSDRLEAGPLDDAALVSLGLDVAAALHAAHGAGLVHRDVKPANIIIAAAGPARVIDFGLAVTGTARTSHDAVVGTFDYSAPEQTGMLARPVDGRADLYAFGVVLFHCATGRLPYQADDVGELLALHAGAPIPDPRVERPQLPAELAELIMRLMAKDPDDRVPTAQALHSALARLAPVGRAPQPLTTVGVIAGRESEQAELVRCWHRARSAQGGIVLLEGPPGVGKSTLARHAARIVEADGGLVLSGKCDADSSLPLAPLRTALDAYAHRVSELPAEQRTARVEDLRAAAGVDAGLLHPLSPTLAGLLDAPPPAAEDRHDQFAAAVASFLCALATRSGGLLLIIDDIQWLDPVGRDVLRRLDEEMAEAALLLLATARDDAAAGEAVAVFVANAGSRLHLRLPVRPLDDAGTVRLVASYLAGGTVGPEVTAELIALGRGNPLTVLEYLRALIDAGALRPSWGTWRLEADRLRAIELPTDVFELVLGRIDGLGAQARGILTAAAALGSRFEPEVLALVAAADPSTALAEAVHRGLLNSGGRGYTFVHDRIREALLSAVEPDQQRALHRRIAAVLAAQDRTDPPHVYAVARHFAGGGLEHDQQAVYTTGWAAGRLALSEHAREAAVSFLEVAAAAAEVAGIQPESRFREALAVAYLSKGDVTAARDQLEPALDSETDPLRRAALLLQLAHVRRTGWEPAAAIDCVRTGLAELGRPLPRNPVLLVLSTAGPLLRWLVGGVRRPAAHPAVGAEAERLRLHSQLCRAALASATIAMRFSLALVFNARALRHINRVGRSAEHAIAYGSVGILAGGFRLYRRKRKLFQRLAVSATKLADPQLQAFLAWADAFGDYVGKRGTAAQLGEVSERHWRWLEVDHYLNAVLIQARDLTVRGYAEETLTLLDRARGRVAGPAADQIFDLALAEGTARSMLGQEVNRPALLAKLGEPGLERGYVVQLAVEAVQTAVEQDDLGEPFDAATEAFDRLRIPIPVLQADQRVFLVAEAFGRLSRCRRPGPEGKAALIGAAAGAVRRLGRAADDPVLRAHHAVAQAGLSHLRGESAQALDILAAAEKHLVRLDAPLVHFEAARMRARALRALGSDVLVRRHAEQALALAARHGWARRQRWVRSEFGISETATRGITGHTRQSASVSSRYKRRLEALQQVSAAAAKVLDPQQLARVALDQTLRILGAERAILFLSGDDGRLRPSLGRTPTGELTEMTGYSASLVDRVAAGRQPLVVTGGDEGAALGSQSTIVHGLRSIMIAPLELEGRLLGALYLDSRVAKGVFAVEDIDILTAVTSQIAVSLETARAAQLEVAVQAAGQQRDTAEVLRAAMSELTETLDSAEVLRRLRDIVTRTLPAERVWLLHRDGAELTVTATVDTQSAVIGDIDALALGGPRSDNDASVPAELTPMLDGFRSWLVTPLATRGHGIGLLVAGSAAAGQFGRAQLDVAAALAGQGGVAYANARLFAQVQELATTDGLTGVFNRRHFTELATRQIGIAARNDRPLAALMVDIDHFKRINDTYGHGTGDEVIRAVADALREGMREPDILCRYGGEEFAVVVSEMHGNPLDLGERLRAGVASLNVPGPDEPVRVTVSIGVAEMKPDDRLDDLLARADEALYRAKNNGRNMVVAG